MEARRSEADVVLTLDTNLSPGFLGYQIERKKLDEDFLVWDGLGWSSGPAYTTNGFRFVDPNVPEGIFQYRATAKVFQVPDGDFLYSDWVVMGDDRIGWSFGNYSPPPGKFASILTPDDLRFTYLWGIEAQSSSGDFFSDAQIMNQVLSSAAEIERALKLTIFKKKIRFAPTADLVPGIDFDEEEDAYSYRPEKWVRTGYITLRRRPILSLERLDLFSAVGTKLFDLLPWARLEKHKGIIRLYPKASSQGSFNQAALSITGGSLFNGGGMAREPFTSTTRQAMSIPVSFLRTCGTSLGKSRPANF